MRIKKLKSWIIILLTTLVLTTIVFNFLLYNTYSAIFAGNIFSAMKKSNEQVNENIVEYLRDAESLTDIATDEKTIAFFESIPSKQKETEIIKSYSNVIKTKSNLEDIFLISLDNVNNISFKKGLFSTRVTTTMQDWYNKTKQNPGYTNIISTHSEDYSSSSSGNPVITLSKMVFDKNGKAIGILLIDLGIKKLENICRSAKIGERGQIYIIDENGNVVYSTATTKIMRPFDIELSDLSAGTKANILERKINGEKMLIDYSTSDYTGWKILNMVSKSEVSKMPAGLIIKITIIIVVLIVISLLLNWLFDNKLIKLLNILKNKMNKAAEGDMGINSSIRGPSEVQELDESFNRLISRIDYLMKKNSDEQKIIRISELKALQAQINPHFLYNTLDSIVWLAEDTKLDEVITMTLALARFFRIGLSKGNDIIAINEEIEHVRNYLIIQSYRYSNQFQYVIDIDQEILQYKTPKLILQPLVENAIYHGIKNNERPGIIKVLGLKINNRIMLEVIDNGSGMTAECLENLLASFEIKDDGNEKRSFGMKNVHERLQLLFGKEYGLKVFSEYGRETRVEVWLPAMKEEI